MIEAYMLGATLQEAAQRLGYNETTCSNVLRRRGIKQRGHREAHRQYAVDEHFFDQIDTAQKAYWLGFLTADGSITRNRVTLALKHTDVDHVRKFAAAVQSQNPIFFFENVHRGIHYIVARIDINSCRTIAALFKLGLKSNKTFTVKPSDQIPEDYLSDYWRGIFDGDGHIGRSGRARSQWKLNLCGNRFIVDGFRDYMSQFITSKATIRPMGRIFEITYTGTTLPITVAEILYGNAKDYLDRKYALFEEMIDA